MSKALQAVTRALALTGGVLLMAAAALTVVSVIGRYAFGAPVPGDYELVEIGCAVGVFLFFPYTHAVDGNISAEFFTAGLPARARRALDLGNDVVFTIDRLAADLAAGGRLPREIFKRRDLDPDRHSGLVGLWRRGCVDGAVDAGLPAARRRGGRAAMSHLELGVALFVLMIVLIVLRMPIAIAMLVTGALGFGLIAGWRPLARPDERHALFARRQSRPHRHSAVRADGPVRRARRHQPGALSLGARLGRAFPRRHRHGDHRRLRRLRRDLRLVGGDRRHHGLDRAAGDAPLRLFRGAVDRRAGGRRHARHFDSAVDHPGDLRHPHRAVARTIVPRGHRARHHRHHRLRRGDLGLYPPLSGGRAGGCARELAASACTASRRCGRCWRSSWW